jgi:hypothetical protein
LQVRVRDNKERGSHSHPPNIECSKRAWYRPYSSTLCKIASKVTDWPIAEVVHMCLGDLPAARHLRLLGQTSSLGENALF